MENDLFEEGVSKELAYLVDGIAEEILNSGLTADEVKRNGKYLVHKTNCPKTEYCRMLAEGLCSPSVFNRYFDSFSEKQKDIIIDIVFKSAVIETDVLLKEFAPEERLHYSPDYEKLPFSFAIKYSYSFVVLVPPNIKTCLKIQLAKLRPADIEITDDDFRNRKGYFSEKDGLEFYLHSAQVMQVLNDSGFFERDAGSSILKSTLAKIKKVASLVPFTFFTNEKDVPKGDCSDDFTKVCTYSKKQLNRMMSARLTLALSLISFAVNKICADCKTKDVLMKFFQAPQKMYREFLDVFCNAQDASFDANSLYPHIAVYSMYDVNTYRGKMMKNFVTLVKQNPPVQATDFSYYIDLLSSKGLPHFFNAYSASAHFKYAYDFYYNYEDEAYIHYEKISLSKDAVYNAFVQLPAYNNLFLALASLGLFEITWEPPCVSKVRSNEQALAWMNEANKYCYGKIGYIKITPLGAYTFGLTDKIKIEGVKSFAAPKLDENSLLIHIEKGDKTMEVFLEPFCTAISHTLYKVDEIRLKKFCKSKEEVETVFSTLSSRAENKLPRIWKELKDSIKHSFVSLCYETDWSVISLENQSPEFVRFVEKLSHTGLCTKMEGKRIAVKKENQSQFKRKLEAEGYKI